MLKTHPYIGAKIEEMSPAGLVQMARNALNEDQYGDCIYFSYRVFMSVATAFLKSQRIKADSDEDMLQLFALHYTDSMGVASYSSLPAMVYEIHERPGTRDFARSYFNRCEQFYIDITTA